MPKISLGDFKNDFAKATLLVATRRGATLDSFAHILARDVGYTEAQTTHFLKGEWEQLGPDGELIARDHLQKLGFEQREGETILQLADRFIDNKRVRKPATSGLVVDREAFAASLRAYIRAESITPDGYDMLARNVFNDLHQGSRGPLIAAMLDPTNASVTLLPKYFETVAEDCGFQVPMIRAKPAPARAKPATETDGVAGGGRG